MTPQSCFMILATIDPAHEAELRGLLESMNREPGILDPMNAFVPFGEFKQLHYARIVILDDQTLGDIEVYGSPRVNYPTYIAFLGDCDGPVDRFFTELVARAEVGLRHIFMHCKEYAPGVDLLRWIKAQNVAPAANYVNWIG